MRNMANRNAERAWAGEMLSEFCDTYPFGMDWRPSAWSLLFDLFTHE